MHAPQPPTVDADGNVVAATTRRTVTSADPIVALAAATSVHADLDTAKGA